MTDNDTDLRERFAQLRAEERVRIPRFAPRYRPERRPTAWRLITAPALLLLVIMLILMARPRRTSFSESDRIAARSVAAWHPPTDFLLHTPGSELLTTTPRIPDLKGIPR
jgi:hypothetical protein